MSKLFHKFLSVRVQLDAVTVIALSTVFLIVFDNYAFWSSLIAVIDLSDPSMWLFLVACFLLIFSVCFIFLSSFAVSRFFKPVISFLFILAACTSYFMDAYGTVFDDVMVMNIVETNFHESMELFDIALVLHVLAFGILPVLFLYRIDVSKKPMLLAVRNRVISIVVVVAITSLSVLISYKDLSFVFRENRETSFFINPVYPMRAIYRYSIAKYRDSHRQFIPVFEDAHMLPEDDRSDNLKPNLLVLVVGETARAQSYQLNSYARETNPYLVNYDVFNFSDVSSCGTATAVSLPCMFSDFSKQSFDVNRVRDRQNLMDALHIAGLDVLWLENNPDCKGICSRVPTATLDDIATEELCRGGQCYDELLVTALAERLVAIKKDTVIVLHIQGSHGPAYYRRYPEKFKRFLPECDQAAVQDCTDEEVVNAYDNTILYTDYVLSKVIDLLQKNADVVDAAMLYVSDHGESLGEGGIYLHGLPYFIAPEYQTKVPMILWMSDNFIDDKSIDRSCLIAQTKTELSHDNYLHSVLGLMDVAASKYQADLDIFSSCRTGSSTATHAATHAATR